MEYMTKQNSYWCSKYICSAFISQAIVRLGGDEFLQKCNYLRLSIFNNNYIEMLTEIIEIAKSNDSNPQGFTSKFIYLFFTLLAMHVFISLMILFKYFLFIYLCQNIYAIKIMNYNKRNILINFLYICRGLQDVWTNL